MRCPVSGHDNGEGQGSNQHPDLPSTGSAAGPKSLNPKVARAQPIRNPPRGRREPGSNRCPSGDERRSRKADGATTTTPEWHASLGRAPSAGASATRVTRPHILARVRRHRAPTPLESQRQLKALVSGNANVWQRLRITARFPLAAAPEISESADGE
jgi:hypothetical protein